MRPHLDESAKLQSTHGITINEISMLSEDTFRDLIRVLQAFPVREECRHRVPAGKQIPMSGYRGIICAGDLRRLPPADGRQPFGCDTTLLQTLRVLCSPRAPPS